MNRIQHSDNVPGILTQALSSLKAKRTASTRSTPIAIVKREANKLPIRIAMAKRKLIARGAGVYEDKANGDIWYREGDFLLRQAVDTNSIVRKYLESCEGK